MVGVAVALVDDQALFLEGVRLRLSVLTEIRIVASGNCAQDITDIVAHSRPDVMIVDISIPGDVFHAIARVTKAVPLTKVIVFTAAAGIGPAVRALDAGATGYILKRGNPAELLSALEAVQRGETYITQSFASQVIGALRNASMRKLAAEAVKLSLRENQIVRLLLLGKSNKEIAMRLAISEKTVKYYMTILMQKLNVRSRLEVVLAAQKLNTEEGLAAASIDGPFH